MTNTKFRKRALLSSVAMLLVALVALGSATFAWFASNPDVSAEGLSVTTSSSTGIKIMSESEEEAGLSNTAANYAQSGIILAAVEKVAGTHAARTDLQTGGTHAITKPIIPKSTATDNLLATGAWVTTRGINASSGAKAAGAAYDSCDLAPGTNCYKEAIYTMQTDASGGEKIKHATVNWATPSNFAIAGCVRVAILGAGGKVLGIWKPIAADVVKDYTPAVADPETAESVQATSVDTAVKGNAIDFAQADWQTVSTTAKDTYVTVLVYFDGEDSDATSGNAAAATSAILDTLSVTLSI